MVSISTNHTVNSTIHLSNIIRAQYATGRITLPQNGGLYSRFKHIQGIPSSSSDGGYSVNKLRMIDLLVDRLIRMKGNGAQEMNRAGSGDPDELFTRYAEELAATIRKTDAVSPSVAASVAGRGLLFDMVA